MMVMGYRGDGPLRSMIFSWMRAFKRLYYKDINRLRKLTAGVPGGEMRRILVVLMALSLLTSCGGSEEWTGDQSTQTSGEEPITMIPDETVSEFQGRANAHLRPFFDEAGTELEKTVSVDEHFDVYVVAEFNPEYPMMAAQYQLLVPEGVSVLASKSCDSTIVTVGSYDHDFMMTFRCSSGPKIWLVKYTCKVAEGFTGGDLQTGVGHDYFGFVLCGEEKVMIPAKGGTATVRVR